MTATSTVTSSVTPTVSFTATPSPVYCGSGYLNSVSNPNGGGAALTDAATTTFVIDVPADAVASGCNPTSIALGGLFHQRAADLRIDITHAGTTYTCIDGGALFTGSAFFGGDYSFGFADNYPAPASGGAPVASGSYRCSVDQATKNPWGSGTMTGQWQVAVVDTASGVEGTLTCVVLQFGARHFSTCNIASSFTRTPSVSGTVSVTTSMTLTQTQTPSNTITQTGE